MKDIMLRTVVFDKYFFSSDLLNIDVATLIIPFMKKYFLPDLIHYLNEKISHSNEEDTIIVSKLKTFMNENFPGSLSFHETVLLKKNIVIMQSSKTTKKGGKESRDYLTAILSMLNNPENEGEKKEIMVNYLDYLINVVVLKLHVEQNSKTLKIIFELLTHNVIQQAQSEILDEQRRNHSKLQILQGFYKFLINNLKNQAGSLFKKEIINTFHSLILISDSDNAVQRSWIFSIFFVLVQCEDLADS